jgi:hypothetical protein
MHQKSDPKENNFMPNDEKRVALVSGGNRGIGFEIAKKLAVQGITVQRLKGSTFIFFF